MDELRAWRLMNAHVEDALASRAIPDPEAHDVEPETYYEPGDAEALLPLEGADDVYAVNGRLAVRGTWEPIR